MCKSFQPRCFAVFQVCLQNNQRQKQQKAEVREKPEGIVNSQGGSKFMLPPALLSFPYPLERKPNTVPLPAEYVL